MQTAQCVKRFNHKFVVNTVQKCSYQNFNLCDNAD